MKHRLTWTVLSVLSVLFFTFHAADDIVRGFEKGQLGNLTAVPLFTVWLLHQPAGGGPVENRYSRRAILGVSLWLQTRVEWGAR